MEKTYEKFNDVLGEKYWANSVKGDPGFYSAIERVLELYFGEGVIGLDVGAGPGVGAWMLNKIGVSGEVFSVEPSDNYKEGELLSKKLKESGSRLKYFPKKGTMAEAAGLFNLKKGSLDFVMFLRAAHEIMLSYDRYEDFVRDFEETCALVKKGGMVVLADPQYSDFVNSDSEEYGEVIKEIRKYKEKTLGHSHGPEDYLTFDKLEKIMAKNFYLVEKIELENLGDLEFLRSKGFELDKSPTQFYVICFRKK